MTDDRTKIEDVYKANIDRLMAIEGVIGCAIGREGGDKIIQVHLASESAVIRNAIPAKIGRFRVVSIVTGEASLLS